MSTVPWFYYMFMVHKNASLQISHKTIVSFIFYTFVTTMFFQLAGVYIELYSVEASKKMFNSCCS